VTLFAKSLQLFILKIDLIFGPLILVYCTTSKSSYGVETLNETIDKGSEGYLVSHP
jgi:hypothetical protein